MPGTSIFLSYEKLRDVTSVGRAGKLHVGKRRARGQW